MAERSKPPPDDGRSRRDLRETRPVSGPVPVAEPRHGVDDPREVLELRIAALESQRAKVVRAMAFAAHELRGRISASQGWLHLLASEGASLHPRAIPILERSLEAQARLVEDLLDASRFEAAQTVSLRKERVGVAALVHQAIEGLAPIAAAKGVDLVAGTMRGAFVLGDATRLSQVLANVVGNAVKFTEAGGRVSLEGRLEPREVVLVVADDGCGIEASQLEHVFEAFHRGQEKVEGLGVGLYLADEIVRLHGGSIEVESELGVGSRFRIRLPRLAG